MENTMQERVELIGNLAFRLTRAGYFLATAESCTGGLIAAACTEIAGSSDWFKGGVVAYSNDIKENVLGVPRAALEGYGAVSGPIVEHMALGALRVCGAEASIAVSGVAGPGGGTKAKPVGTVWIAVAVQEREGVCTFNLDEIAKGFPGCRRESAHGKHALVFAERRQFDGDRASVRNQAVDTGLYDLLRLLEENALG